MLLAEFIWGKSAATLQVEGHPSSGIVGWGGGTPALAGVNVDENTAMTYSAVWAATRLLAGTGSGLPLNLYRRLDGGGKEIDSTNPLHACLHDAPNEEMSSMSWRMMAIAHQVNWGNTYSEIERDGAGRVVALWPIHPSRVQPDRIDGRYVYRVYGDRRDVPFPSDDIFHVPSLITDDGICGKGVIRHARESIGFGMGTERHGAAYFGNGARPNVVVTHPRQLSKEARQNFRREWREIHGGPDKAGELALLQEGADVKIMNVSPEDSQFLETRQHNIEEIARWYGVPPHLIGHLLRSTFSNIEAQGIEFVVYSLLPWLKLWEQEIWRKLIPIRERAKYFAKHVVDALLRGDAPTRSAALQTQFINGAITQDEWRDIEDRNPLPDGYGKKHYVQGNLTPVEKAGEMLEPKAPFATPAAEPEEIEDERDQEAAKFRSAARCVLVDALSRMVSIETTEATRAAKNPTRFVQSLEDFYGRHISRVAEAVRPAVKACRVVGIEITSRTVAEQHVELSKSELLAASECQPACLSERVADCIETWRSRGERLADQLFQGVELCELTT